jgi:hypothetical protein
VAKVFQSGEGFGDENSNDRLESNRNLCAKPPIGIMSRSIRALDSINTDSGIVIARARFVNGFCEGHTNVEMRCGLESK